MQIKYLYILLIAINTINSFSILPITNIRNKQCLIFDKFKMIYNNDAYSKTPIPIISFDTLLTNIKNVNHVIVSDTADRIIIIYGHGKKGVFYISNEDMKKTICVLSYTNSTHTLQRAESMDDPYNIWYCKPRVFKKNYTNYI